MPRFYVRLFLGVLLVTTIIFFAVQLIYIASGGITQNRLFSNLAIYAALILSILGTSYFLVRRAVLQQMEYKLDLEEVKAFTESILNSLSDTFHSFDLEGKPIKWNKAAGEITGYSDEEISSMGPADFVSEEDRQGLESTMAEALEGGRGPSYEATVVAKDGRRIPFEFGGSLLTGQDGNVIGFGAIGRDVTERRRSEESRDKLVHDLGERVKELNSLYGLSRLIERPGITLEEILWGTVELLPPSCQYPKITCARLELGDLKFKTDNYRVSEWMMSADIVLHGKREGTLEVGYLEERPRAEEGPFLAEERNLIDSIAERLGKVIEHMRGKQQLVAAKERWERSFKDIGEGMFIIDKDFTVLQCNEAFANLVGDKPDNLIGHKCYELVHNLDGPPDFCITCTAVKEEKGIRAELYEPSLDKHIAVSADPSFDSEGNFEFAIHVVRDISDRKELEQALRESEEKYRMIADNVTDVIWSMDMEMNWTYQSPSIEYLTGYTVEEAMQVPIDKTMTPESVELAFKILAEFMEEEKQSNKVEGRTLELEAYKKDGSTFWTEVTTSILRNEDGEPVSILGVTRDITERREAEEALRESEMRYRDLFENANDLIQSVGPDMKFQYVNKKWRDILGYTEEEVKDITLMDIIHPDSWEHCLENFKDVIDGGEVSGVQAQFVAKDGRAIDVEGNINCRVEHGIPVATRGLFRDVTDRKRAEEGEKEAAAAQARAEAEREKAYELKKAYDELRNTQALLVQSEKLSALGELGAGVAHELNSPLAGVLSLTRTHMKGIDPDSEEYVDLEDMEEACEHMAKIIRDFTSFTRVSTGELEELDINDAIEATLTFGAPQLTRSEITIEKKYGKDLPPVKGEKSQLQQVVLNMITNARDAISEKGVLNITTRTKDIDKVLFVEMEFYDTGCGISEENIGKIFDPFYTTKRPGGGVGLGLSITHTIVKAHDGEITVESEVGKGTTFTVRLPAGNPRLGE